MKKEKDFHLEKVTESTQDVDEGIPAKRRKTNEIKKVKGNKYFELKNSWGADGAPQTRTTC